MVNFNFNNLFKTPQVRISKLDMVLLGYLFSIGMDIKFIVDLYENPYVFGPVALGVIISSRVVVMFLNLQLWYVYLS